MSLKKNENDSIRSNIKANIIYISDFPPQPGELDDSPRIQRAINEVQKIGGGTLQLGAETYVLNDRLTLYSNLTFAGIKNLTKLDATKFPKGDQSTRPYLMQGRGSIKKTLEATVDLIEGQTRIPVSGDLAGILIGDLFSIKSQERQYKEAGSHIPYKEELQKIVEVDYLNSIIVVDGGLLFDYKKDNHLAFDIIDPISDVTLKNFEIIMGGEGSIHGGIQFSNAFNIYLDFIRIDGAENVAVNMSRTYKFIVQNSVFLNSTSPRGINFNSGYGVNVTSTSCYGKIVHNVFDNCRHGISGGNHAPHHIEVINNLLTNCRIGYAIDCHEPCIYWTISFNTIRGCVSGITARGMYVTVADNIINNMTNIGIAAGATSTLPLPFIKQYIIRNNRITHTGGRAINITGSNGAIEDVVIQGNVCVNTERIRVNNSKNILVIDNFMDQLNVDSPTRNSLQFVNCENISIHNNKLIGVGGYGVLVENVMDVLITGNLMQQGGTSTNANDGVRAIRCHQLQIINNQFKNFLRLSAFTTESDHIIFTNNMINVNDNNIFRFVGANNVIQTANLSF